MALCTQTPCCMAGCRVHIIHSISHREVCRRLGEVSDGRRASENRSLHARSVRLGFAGPRAWLMRPHYTLLYSTLLCSTLLHSTPLYSTSTRLYSKLLCKTSLYFAPLYCAMLCHAAPCYAMIYHAMLPYLTLAYTTLVTRLA